MKHRVVMKCCKSFIVIMNWESEQDLNSRIDLTEEVLDIPTFLITLKC